MGYALRLIVHFFIRPPFVVMSLTFWDIQFFPDFICAFGLGTQTIGLLVEFILGAIKRKIDE